MYWAFCSKTQVAFADLLTRIGMAMSDQTDRVTRSMLSVIIPVNNESNNIGPMKAALDDAASRSDWLDWEFLFVEDGSTDDTFERLQRAHKDDSRVKVIRLSRNYGSHTAAAAGLRY